jgi:hypothetical protein
MGLITWIAVVVTILAIIGLGWNVFVSGVYKGAQKIMGSSSNLVFSEPGLAVIARITGCDDCWI